MVSAEAVTQCSGSCPLLLSSPHLAQAWGLEPEVIPIIRLGDPVIRLGDPADAARFTQAGASLSRVTGTPSMPAAPRRRSISHWPIGPSW